MEHDRITIENCDFAGWATKKDLECTDGRIIRKDAFKHCDGLNVPLFWNHQHEGISNVLGKATLEHRDDGVYAYGQFNDTEDGIAARKAVMHGDVRSLSIFANGLKQNGKDVVHGIIRELSLVPAGANPGAFIDYVMAHGEDGDDGFVAGYDENIMVVSHSDISHSDESKETSKEENKVAEETKKSEETTKSEDKTIQEIIDTMTEEQKTAMYAVVGAALEGEGSDDEDEKENKDEVSHSEGGNDTMKTNVFDNDTAQQGGVLTHADQKAILDMARQSNVGSFKLAMELYAQDNESLAHGLDLGDEETFKELLPDYKLITPGAPDILEPDQSWVMGVINKIHKSPFSRIRTRRADALAAEIREKIKAKGYKKGEEKKLMEHIKLLHRTFDPQTIYVKDEINRDDIVDITDFSIVDYQWKFMKAALYETLALAALVGDGREDIDPDKIKEDHVRPIWTDDELYTIHRIVDVEKMKKELQGTNTDMYFGENFIYSEAIIQEALYAREQYKGSGKPDFYCAPHLVNVMLLARDRDGRRMYSSKADLVKALNVNDIVEIEQLSNKTRTDGDVNKKLLGLFVNLADYQFGSTKGGEVTKFEDFDIDFNKYKYLLETRLSGGLVKPYAAIALEETIGEVAAG